MTKKIISTLILSLAIATGSQAQDKFKQELSVGPSFGTTFSSVSFTPTVKTKMLMGYTGGVTLRWNTEKNLGLQAELNFTQQGWEEQFDDPKYQYIRTVNYIELPLFTHIYFGSKHVKVFLNLGPKLGYAIGEKTTENLNGAEPNKSNEQHSIPIQQKFDWGICGGPGLEIRTSIGSFLLEGRYYYALGDVFHSRKEDPFPKSSNQVISAKITYLLPILK